MLLNAVNGNGRCGSQFCALQARFEPLNERVGVVALVSNHGDGREVFEQRLSLSYIVNLPRRERERDWIAKRIDGHVDFRRQSATRAADRLILAVFFLALALCRCARVRAGAKTEACCIARRLLRMDSHLTVEKAINAWPFPPGFMDRMCDGLEVAGVRRN